MYAPLGFLYFIISLIIKILSNQTKKTKNLPLSKTFPLFSQLT